MLGRILAFDQSDYNCVEYIGGILFFGQASTKLVATTNVWRIQHLICRTI